MATRDHVFPVPHFAVFWPIWLALFCAIAILGWSLLSGVPFNDYAREHGPIETAGFLTFLIATIAMVTLVPERGLGRSWYVTVLFALMAARELDFDKRFTEKGVLQLRLYTGDYPLSEKLIGAAVVLLLLTALVLVVRRGLPAARTAIAEGRGDWAWTAFAGLALMVISKPLDGLGRRLDPLGVDLSPSMVALASFLEEGLEMAFGFALLLAVCLWARSVKEGSTPP